MKKIDQLVEKEEVSERKYLGFTDPLVGAHQDYGDCFAGDNFFCSIVCDGMGGHSGGAFASQTTVETIRSTLLSAQSLPEDINEQYNLLNYAINKANNAIWRYAQENLDGQICGTTLTILLAVENQHHWTVHLCHIGDSRIYAFADDLESEIGFSFDHTPQGDRLFKETQGENTSEYDQYQYDELGQLNNAIGVGEGPIELHDFYTEEVPFDEINNQVYVLCTDGLYDVLVQICNVSVT